MLTNKRQAKYAVVLASAFFIASVGEVKARTAIGQASATVISAIASTPIEIRLQASPLNVQNTSAGFGFASFQSSGGVFSVTAQPVVSLIGINANGVASFSVSGDSTSSYVVRSLGAESTVSRTQAVSPNGTASGSLAASAALIVPAQALIGGSRLSIVISQATELGRWGDTIVEINYN